MNFMVLLKNVSPIFMFSNHVKKKDLAIDQLGTLTLTESINPAGTSPKMHLP